MKTMNIMDMDLDIAEEQKPIGRPKLPGEHLYIRLLPGTKKKIDEIKNREEIRVGKLSINHIVNHLLLVGIGYYFFAENPQNPKTPKTQKK